MIQTPSWSCWARRSCLIIGGIRHSRAVNVLRLLVCGNPRFATLSHRRFASLSVHLQCFPLYPFVLTLSMSHHSSSSYILYSFEACWNYGSNLQTTAWSSAYHIQSDWLRFNLKLKHSLLPNSGIRTSDTSHRSRVRVYAIYKTMLELTCSDLGYIVWKMSWVDLLTVMLVSIVRTQIHTDCATKVSVLETLWDRYYSCIKQKFRSYIAAQGVLIILWSSYSIWHFRPILPYKDQYFYSFLA